MNLIIGITTDVHKAAFCKVDESNYNKWTKILFILEKFLVTSDMWVPSFLFILHGFDLQKVKKGFVTTTAKFKWELFFFSIF